MGRNSKCSKCVRPVASIHTASSSTAITNNNIVQPKKVMPHDEFINRIRKSLYFGGGTLEKDMEVSRPLAEYASEIFSEPQKGHSLNRLNTVAAGSVESATPCSLIMALIYLERLNNTNPGYVRGITPQELFIVSMMISTKFYEGHDGEYYFSDWAEDGNMTEKRLKKLELEFLCAIDWNIYISNEEFFNKLTNIEKTLARREGLKRGWLTYTELMQMLPSFTLVKFLLNNITVMAISYAASVMTIAGAFFLATQVFPGTLDRKTTSAHTTSAEIDITAQLMENTIVSSQPTPASAHTPQNRTGIMHTEQTDDDSNSNANNLPRHHHSRPDVVTINVVNKLNATCTVFNVEEEIFKLEREYREEALREELMARNNEIASVSRLLLPDVAEQKKLNGNIYAHDILRNWLVLKEEYSDMMKQHLGKMHAMNSNANVPKTRQVQVPDKSQTQQEQYYTPPASCFSERLIKLIAATTQVLHSMRMPTMWFKFI